MSSRVEGTTVGLLVFESEKEVIDLVLEVGGKS